MHADPFQPAPVVQPRIAAGFGLSGHADTRTAQTQVIEQAAAALAHAPAGGPSSSRADLALVFATPHHADSLGQLHHALRSELRVKHTIGVTAESVAGGATELERVAGLSVLAVRMPGVRVSPFRTEDLMTLPDESAQGTEQAGQAIDAGPETRATILFGDPFSVPITSVVQALNRVRREMGVRAPLLGGMASGADRPLGNRLLLDGTVRRDGMVGLTISGPVRADAVVSQGCRPIGEPMVITSAQRNIIRSLGGQPALRALEDAVAPLEDAERHQLGGGLFIGRAVTEYKDRFGRGDFLVRRIVGADQEKGSLAADDLFRTGQTVQFHLRDAETATEDLELLLNAQQLHGPPAAALLVSCNGRGRRLFNRPHHDAAAIEHAFLPARGGEQTAKPGNAAHADPPPVPLAGFFAAGEIGPVGADSHIHGQSACALLLRDPDPHEG